MKFYDFQRQDLARSCLHDGHIMSWDTGGGKTLAAFTYPLLKLGYSRMDAAAARPTALEPVVPVPGDRLQPDGPVLLIAPGDLHLQMARDGAKLFHAECVPLSHQDVFLKLATGPDGLQRQTEDGRPVLPPGYYLTSYTQLASNGRQPFPEPSDTDPRGQAREFCLPLKTPPGEGTGPTGCRPGPLTRREDPPYNGRSNVPLPESIEGFYDCREAIWATAYQTLQVTAEDTAQTVTRQYNAELRRLQRELANCPNDDAAKFVQNQIAALERAYELVLRLAPARAPRAVAAVYDRRGAEERRSQTAATERRSQTAATERRSQTAATERRSQTAATGEAETAWDCLTLAQQDWVIREYLERWLDAARPSVGAARTYARQPDGSWRPTEIEAEAEMESPDALPEADAVLPEEESAAAPCTRTIRCVWQPTLADLCYSAFHCVVVDEGVRMKGEDTLIGTGVRLMDAPYRMVLTATPVKNRLPDIFRLAWWAAGGRAKAHARFPYPGTATARAQFTAQFMVSETNLSAAAADRAAGRKPRKARYVKLTPEVCRIHLLWKLFAPIILRRRKADFGVDLVARTRHAVRVPLATQQSQVYAYHLVAPYLDKNGQPALGAKLGARLQALRIAAADPSSRKLKNFGPIQIECSCLAHNAEAGLKIPAPTCPHCAGTGALVLPHRVDTPWTPKLASVLQLIEEIVARGEQVLVGSAFHDPLDTLATLLKEAGVRHVVLDGRTDQRQRAAKAERFKAGRGAEDAEPVALAGVESMSDGHSFHRCPNVILLAYSWAFDKFKQFLDRVYRLNSERPVNVYVVLADGTIDAKLESQVDQKSDAQELVLDGRLLGDRPEELSLADLMQVAQDEFKSATGRPTVDAAALEAAWPAQCARLREAQRMWDVPAGIPSAAPSEDGRLKIEDGTETPSPESILHPPAPSEDGRLKMEDGTETPSPESILHPPSSILAPVPITVTAEPMPAPTPVPIMHLNPDNPPPVDPVTTAPQPAPVPEPVAEPVAAVCDRRPEPAPAPAPAPALSAHAARRQRMRDLANRLAAAAGPDLFGTL